MQYKHHCVREQKYFICTGVNPIFIAYVHLERINLSTCFLPNARSCNFLYMNNSTDFFLFNCRCLYCFHNDLLFVVHVRVQLYLFLNLQSVLAQTQLYDTALSMECFSPLQGCSLKIFTVCEHIHSCVVWIMYEVAVSSFSFFCWQIYFCFFFFLSYFSWYLGLKKSTRRITTK